MSVVRTAAICTHQESKNRTRNHVRNLAEREFSMRQVSRTKNYSMQPTCTTTGTAHITLLRECLIIYGSNVQRSKQLVMTNLYNWAVNLYVKHSLSLLAVSESPI